MHIWQAVSQSNFDPALLQADAVPARQTMPRRRAALQRFDEDALQKALDIVQSLERKGGVSTITSLCFPHLEQVWNAASAIWEGTGESSLTDFDCVVVDEAQDLTWIEWVVCYSSPRKCRGKRVG